MLPSPTAFFHNASDRSRFARPGSFPISSTDFSIRIQSHCRHLCAHTITFPSSGGPDPQPPGEAAHWDPIRGLKENA